MKSGSKFTRMVILPIMMILTLCVAAQIPTPNIPGAAGFRAN